MDSIHDLVDSAIEKNVSISSIIVTQQALDSSVPEKDLIEKMSLRYQVMRDSVRAGIRVNKKSVTGLSGGDACLMDKFIEGENNSGAELSSRIIRNALAVSEVNASMGRIVAAPTAGSCGIIPGLLTVLEDEKKIERDKVVLSLFTAAGFGTIIDRNSTLSGAEGGCQAECGSAAAMAAAAGCELLGGNPEQVSNAFSLSLINLMGLVCDPVGGYVEYPCVYRNGMGAVNAFAAIEMALAGIKSIIPPDEIISAMKEIGSKMDMTLKETSLGGLAATPAACRISKNLRNL